MKRWVVYLLIAGLMVGTGLFATYQLVKAQEPTPTSPADGWGFGRGGRMGGMMYGDGQVGVMHDAMHAALAAKLDMTVEDFEKAYADGKTFWDLAEEKGISSEDAQQMMIDARNEALDKSVAAGDLTQEQADWMKSRMGSHTPGDCMDGANGGGGMMGRGRGGWRWSQSQGTNQ